MERVDEGQNGLCQDNLLVKVLFIHDIFLIYILHYLMTQERAVTAASKGYNGIQQKEINRAILDD